MKKNSSLLVILIPILVALLGVAYVGYPRLRDAFAPVESNPVQETGKSAPSLTGKVGEPQTGFSDVTVKPVSDLRKSFESTEYSDTSDLESLSHDAASL